MGLVCLKVDLEFLVCEVVTVDNLQDNKKLPQVFLKSWHLLVDNLYGCISEDPCLFTQCESTIVKNLFGKKHAAIL